MSRDKVTGLVIAVACLAFAAIGLQVNDPPEFGYLDAVREEVITIEQAQLSAGEVEVGTRLVRDGRVEAETTGMFVTVRTTLAVPGRQRVTLNRSRLITENRTYDNWSHTALSAEPGFGQTQDLVFEVDPAQIDDLSLEIWYGAVVHRYYQRARIHLGITAANAADWRRAAAGRDLEPDPYGLTEALP